MKTFSDLSFEAQAIIHERFIRYGIDGKTAFDSSGIFSNEAKNLSDKDLIIFLDNKDISHIYPKSKYPEYREDIDNIFLEDSAINRARGSEIVTPDELQAAWTDQIHDTFDLDVNEDGLLDLSGIENDFDSYFLDVSELINESFNFFI